MPKEHFSLLFLLSKDSRGLNISGSKQLSTQNRALFLTLSENRSPQLIQWISREPEFKVTQARAVVPVSLMLLAFHNAV